MFEIFTHVGFGSLPSGSGMSSTSLASLRSFCVLAATGWYDVVATEVSASGCPPPPPPPPFTPPAALNAAGMKFCLNQTF